MQNKPITPLARPVIGYVLKGYPRLSETFISNEILFLEKLGFTLRLFSMRQPRENFSHASVAQIKARVDYLPTELLLELPRLMPANVFMAVKQPQRYRQALALAATRYRRTGKLATLKHLFQAGYMTNRFLLKEPEIRHLHGHFAHSPTSVTLFASLLSALPFSFTAHAKDIYTSNPAQLKEKIDKARFVVTCTQHNAENLQQIAAPSTTPIHCIYHGIDLKLFHNAKEKITTPAEPYRLFTVARMTEKKGLPSLYQALAILRRQGIRFTHILIGDGDDRQSILQLISDMQLTDVCEWLGSKSHEEVLAHFKQADLFVLACKIARSGDRDGIPNVLVESLAMGVPAVSTTVSAIPEILIHGKTGHTVPPSDPEALAAGIRRMLEDQSYRQQIIAAGKEHVATHFDNRSWVKQLAEIFAREPQLAALKSTLMSNEGQ